MDVQKFNDISIVALRLHKVFAHVGFIRFEEG